MTATSQPNDFQPNDFQPNDFWTSVFADPQPTQDLELLRHIGFIPGLRETLMLRQIHALEHATVWVLSGAPGRPTCSTSVDEHWIDTGTLGGLSTEQGFYLYGQVNTGDIRRAAEEALARITHGEWSLAVHPRCGTNVSVGMMLTALLALGMHFLLPRGPIEQLLGLGVAASTATQLTPEVGRLVQQYITTAVPFNLTIEDVTIVPDSWGRPTHFVQTRWIERDYRH